ncbi:MAG: flagellar export chaperone FliS [Oscillospiraceae bacterium]
MNNNPYANYKQNSVYTMTQGELLLLLYDEIIKQMEGAKVFIAEKDIQKKNAALKKAQRIFNHLTITLNHKYAISSNLSSLYDFFNRQLIQANIKNDIKFIDDIMPMVCDLRDAFAQADKNVRSGNAGTTATPSLGQTPVTQSIGNVG